MQNNFNQWDKNAVPTVPSLPATSTDLAGFRRYHAGRNVEYYCDTTTFSGPAAAWYRVGVGATDNFTRADSANDIGNTLENSAWWNAWTAAQGTWGINTNKAYIAAAETNNDIVMVPLGTNNPTIQCQVSGTLNSATILRTPGLAFNGLDKDNHLYVDLVNGAVRLNKRDAAANTSLTTAATTTTDGVTYTLTVVRKGRFVSVWVDGVAKITNYDLTNANAKFLNYTWGGLRLGLAGAPATAARWSNFVARQAA